MKKLIALMVMAGFLVATAPQAFAENGGGVQQPWYNPSTQQSVPEVPVVTPPPPGTHAPVEDATFFTGPVLVGLGVVAIGVVALAVGGSSGGSTPAATNH